MNEKHFSNVLIRALNRGRVTRTGEELGADFGYAKTSILRRCQLSLGLLTSRQYALLWCKIYSASTRGKLINIKLLDISLLVGSINYPAVITRPDVAYTASKLAEHLQNPGLIHIAAAERCIRYLDTTRYHALEFGANDDITQCILIISCKD